MTDEIKNLALYRLSRAEESFNDGNILLKSKSWNSAINRYYYAAFYAARALLATKGLDSSKHSGVIALFQQHFVKTGIVPEEISKSLPRSFEERIDADYEDFVASNLNDAKRIGERVKVFIDYAQKYLKGMVNDKN